MSQGKPRDTRKEQQWRRWILQWRKSGLSVRAFRARHDLSQPSFHAWRRLIKQRDAAADTFVPVQVVGDLTLANEPPPRSTFEVVVAGGRMLRVAPGFDPATLRQLLAVLEEVPVC
jgi:transposase